MGKKLPNGQKSGGSPKIVASPPKLSPTIIQSLTNFLKKRPNKTPRTLDNKNKYKNDKPISLPVENPNQYNQSLQTTTNLSTVKSAKAPTNKLDFLLGEKISKHQVLSVSKYSIFKLPYGQT